MEHHLTRWNPEDEGRTGYWGPATSSIDWCEANYEHSWYIAEMLNTLSNLGFVALAAFGILKSIQQRLPKRFVVAYSGLAIIGLGSGLFHATLQYSWQLGDELPMIYTSTFVAWIVLDTRPIRAAPNYLIPFGLLLFNLAFTVAYLYAPNPVFHQVAFGALVVTTTARGAFLLFKRVHVTAEVRRIRRLQAWGSISFLLAFIIWNIDNLGCRPITRGKHAIGGPWNWVLEGHSWWHILVGLGCYSVIVAMSALTLLIRDDPAHFELRYKWRLIAWVERTNEGWEAVDRLKGGERAPLLGRRAD